MALLASVFASPSFHIDSVPHDYFHLWGREVGGLSHLGVFAQVSCLDRKQETRSGRPLGLEQGPLEKRGRACPGRAGARALMEVPGPTPVLHRLRPAPNYPLSAALKSPPWSLSLLFCLQKKMPFLLSVLVCLSTSGACHDSKGSAHFGKEGNS